MPNDCQTARDKTAEQCRTDADLRHAIRVATHAIRSTANLTGSMDSEPNQRRLATIAAAIVRACTITGESPSDFMNRYSQGRGETRRFPPGWRYSITHVKGPAGDRLRALQQAKKKITRASRNSPEKVARRARVTAEFERYMVEAQQLIDLGMDDREAIEQARAAMDARASATPAP